MTSTFFVLVFASLVIQDAVLSEDIPHDPKIQDLNHFPKNNLNNSTFGAFSVPNNEDHKGHGDHASREDHLNHGDKTNSEKNQWSYGSAFASAYHGADPSKKNQFKENPNSFSNKNRESGFGVHNKPDEKFLDKKPNKMYGSSESEYDDDSEYSDSWDSSSYSDSQSYDSDSEYDDDSSEEDRFNRHFSPSVKPANNSQSAPSLGKKPTPTTSQTHPTISQTRPTIPQTRTMQKNERWQDRSLSI